jgi:hypothetical protein
MCLWINIITTKLKKKNLEMGFGKTKYCPHKGEHTTSFHNNVVNMNEFFKSEKTNLTLINKQT